MGIKLQKPFTISEIKDSPYAVFIAFLIGVVLMLFGVIAGLWYYNIKADTTCDERVEIKTQQIITILSTTIQERDLYARQNRELKQNQDSIIKEKIAEDVHKILPNF